MQITQISWRIVFCLVLVICGEEIRSCLIVTTLQSSVGKSRSVAAQVKNHVEVRGHE